MNSLKVINNFNNFSQTELENLITKAADKYYNTATPIMEDYEYDILIDILKNKYPKSKVLKSIGAKVKGKNKVKLDYWLGSMDKIKPADIKEYDKWISKYTGNYVLSDKLDGISALLVYRSNNEINLYTRGTADEGLDISQLIKYIKIPSIEKIIELKNTINLKTKKDIIMAFRGELIITKNNFDTNWKTTMKNARNTVGGLIHSKHMNPDLAIDTDFIAYEIVDPIILPENQFKLLKSSGFRTAHYKIYSIINFEILSSYLKKRKDESDYTIDGIIVTNNQLYERNTKSNPEYSFAFKDISEDQIVETIVKDIEWNISKDGLIKPVLILEPVDVGGVQISRVTAVNAKNVVNKKLGKGAVIKLIRSGDVIPKILDVIKPAKKILLPDGDWSWNETQVDIISNQTNSQEILIKNIYHFFSSLNTKGLGEKIIEKLVQSNIDSIKKILNIKINDLLSIDGFKEKSSENIINAIKLATTNIKLSKFMAASNKLGAGIGEERIKQVLDNYPKLLTDYKKWSEEEFINKLKELNGWEEKTSNLFVSNFNDFIKFYNDIKKLVTFEEVLEKKIIKNKYTNKNIVMSGFRDSQLQDFFEKSGAKIVGSISKNTNLLIVKDHNTIENPTEKVKKALELGIEIMAKEEIKI